MAHVEKKGSEKKESEKMTVALERYEIFLFEVDIIMTQVCSEVH